MKITETRLRQIIQQEVENVSAPKAPNRLVKGLKVVGKPTNVITKKDSGGNNVRCGYMTVKVGQKDVHAEYTCAVK